MAIAVVIPCFRVRRSILDVLASIGDEVDFIFVVDDKCPEQSGQWVESQCRDRRVRVVYNSANLGVGGAMVVGYRAALETGAQCIVKVDGDGQMPSEYIRVLIKPIVMGRADYTKGNRFFDLEFLNEMPAMRIFGNAVLSFLSKLALGYWNIMDPTNGFTAISAKVLRLVPLDKIASDFFFECDMLFRLNILKAQVKDIPHRANYRSASKSNLKIPLVLLTFPSRYCAVFAKRILYNYYLRDFNIASVAIIIAFIMLLFGFSFGAYHWYWAIAENRTAPTGTIFLAALTIIVGFNCLLASLTYDILASNFACLHVSLPDHRSITKKVIRSGARKVSKRDGDLTVI